MEEADSSPNNWIKIRKAQGSTGVIHPAMFIQGRRWQSCSKVGKLPLGWQLEARKPYSWDSDVFPTPKPPPPPVPIKSVLHHRLVLVSCLAPCWRRREGKNVWGLFIFFVSVPKATGSWSRCGRPGSGGKRVGSAESEPPGAAAN